MKELADWFKAMAEGRADARNIVVRNNSTIDNATSNVESAGFSGATIISLSHVGGVKIAEGVKIERMKLFYSYYRPLHTMPTQ